MTHFLVFVAGFVAGMVFAYFLVFIRILRLIQKRKKREVVNDRPRKAPI